MINTFCRPFKAFLFTHMNTHSIKLNPVITFKCIIMGEGDNLNIGTYITSERSIVTSFMFVDDLS